MTAGNCSPPRGTADPDANDADGSEPNRRRAANDSPHARLSGESLGHGKKGSAIGERLLRGRKACWNLWAAAAAEATRGVSVAVAEQGLGGGPAGDVEILGNADDVAAVAAPAFAVAARRPGAALPPLQPWRSLPAVSSLRAGRGARKPPRPLCRRCSPAGMCCGSNCDARRKPPPPACDGARDIAFGGCLVGRCARPFPPREPPRAESAAEARGADREATAAEATVKMAARGTAGEPPVAVAEAAAGWEARLRAMSRSVGARAG